MITVYGIPNCDTVKRARAWLADQGLETRFHDFKKQGVPAAELPAWLKAFGRDRLLNRAGNTWRKLDAAAQAGIVDDASASALMLAEPSVIKRPVVSWPDGSLTLSFTPAAFAAKVLPLGPGDTRPVPRGELGNLGRPGVSKEVL